MQKQGEHKSTKITMQQNHIQKKTISAHEFLTCIDETAWLQLTAADALVSKQICRIARSKLMLLLHLVPHRNGHVCCSASQVAVLHPSLAEQMCMGCCAFEQHMCLHKHGPYDNAIKPRMQCKQAQDTLQTSQVCPVCAVREALWQI